LGDLRLDELVDSRNWGNPASLKMLSLKGGMIELNDISVLIPTTYFSSDAAVPLQERDPIFGWKVQETGPLQSSRFLRELFERARGFVQLSTITLNGVVYKRIHL
jgi:hypothetical protein